MSANYGSFCDDFYIDTYINTKFDLSRDRETLLTFFERIQKQFPSMATVERDGDGYSLEEDPESGTNKWVSVDSERLGAGEVNPEDLEKSLALPKLAIELMPYMLGIRPLDIGCIDITFAMDFDYSGNHNEIISDALLNGSPLGNLLDRSAVVCNISPAMVLALDGDCLRRIRVTIDSRTEEMELRSKKYDQDKPIGLCITAREYPNPQQDCNPAAMFERLYKSAVDFMDTKALPNLVLPLANAIAHRR